MPQIHHQQNCVWSDFYLSFIYIGNFKTSVLVICVFRLYNHIIALILVVHHYWSNQYLYPWTMVWPIYGVNGSLRPLKKKQTSPSANRVRILIQYLSHLAVSQLLSWVPYETSVVIDVGPLFLGTMHIVDKPSELIDRFLHCHIWKYKINLLGDAGVLFGEMCVTMCVCVPYA